MADYLPSPEEIRAEAARIREENARKAAAENRAPLESRAKPSKPYQSKATGGSSVPAPDHPWRADMDRSAKQALASKPTPAPDPDTVPVRPVEADQGPRGRRLRPHRGAAPSPARSGTGRSRTLDGGRRIMTKIEIRRLVEAGIKRSGSLRKYAKEMNVSATNICFVVNARRNPGPKLLRSLGLKRVVKYIPIDDGEAEC